MYTSCLSVKIWLFLFQCERKKLMGHVDHNMILFIVIWWCWIAYTMVLFIVIWWCWIAYTTHMTCCCSVIIFFIYCSMSVFFIVCFDSSLFVWNMQAFVFRLGFFCEFTFIYSGHCCQHWHGTVSSDLAVIKLGNESDLQNLLKFSFQVSLTGPSELLSYKVT